MTDTEFVNGVVEWLRDEGWVISKSELTESVLMTKGKRNRDGPEKLLALIAVKDGAVSKKHIKYLLSKAKEADVGTVQVASEHGLPSELSALCDEYGVDEIDSTQISTTLDEEPDAPQESEIVSDEADSWTTEDSSDDNDETFLTRRKALIGMGAIGGAVALKTVLPSTGSSPENSSSNQEGDQKSGLSEAGFPRNPSEDKTREINVSGDVPGTIIITGEYRDVPEFRTVEYLDESETDGDKVGVFMEIKNGAKEGGIAAARVEFYKDDELYKEVIEHKDGGIGFPWVHKGTTRELTYLTDAPTGGIGRFIARFHLNGNSELQTE